MERNHIIGFILIFATLLVFNLVSGPSKEELAKRQKERDSIEQVKNKALNKPAAQQNIGDLASKYGANAGLALKKDTVIALENEVIKVNFSSKGGKIAGVTLKKYMKDQDIKGVSTKSPVQLLEDPKNVFEYNLPMAIGSLKTNELVFNPVVSGNKVDFILTIDSTKQFVQSYELSPNDFTIKYSVATKGFDAKSLPLSWVNYLDKIEKGYQYEQSNSTIYFKEGKESEADYCSCTGDDDEKVENPIDWISNTNQFFNSSLISKSGGFSKGELSTAMIDFKTNDDLKKLTSNLEIPLTSGMHNMEWYVGPNVHDKLASYGIGLEKVISYGSSIFGTINRYVIRPMFSFFNSLFSNKGISIIFIIFLIKMALYPLLYKTLHSQAKMSALKPELAKMKEKYKDDLQKQQMESMKVYQEFGVSPFAGCLPTLLQMPIWIALYRFFPASIEFRQESFLWSSDLSSYDAFFHLPFEIPFMGAHISLFTLLWAISTVVYTYYSTKDVDMSANPAMKYVQYFMPLMFLGFFNSYASALTCYMFFSNLINIIQTVVTRKFVFDESKIRKELEKQKASPKKKSGFAAKYQELMAQSQKIAEEKERQKNKK